MVGGTKEIKYMKVILPLNLERELDRLTPDQQRVLLKNLSRKCWLIWLHLEFSHPDSLSMCPKVSDPPRARWQN